MAIRSTAQTTSPVTGRGLEIAPSHTPTYIGEQLILFVGTQNDYHSQVVGKAVEQRGFKYTRFDIANYPTDTMLTYSLGGQRSSGITISHGGSSWNTDDITHVWY